MTNLESIRNMDIDDLARFINNPIACNELCEDRDCGCAWSCEHNNGRDKIKEWLEREVI